MEIRPIRETPLLVLLAGIQFTHILDFMIVLPLGPQFMRLWGIDTHQFALLVSVYVTLAATGVLPDWLAILVVFRDVIIVGGLGLLWMLGQRDEVRPLAVSKLNTFAQIALAALALAARGFDLPWTGAVSALVWDCFHSCAFCSWMARITSPGVIWSDARRSRSSQMRML